MKVLIVVTHLLGTGHLARALVLGRAFAQQGHDVMIASGGMPAPHLSTKGIKFVQLPPLRSDGVNFQRLLNQNGEPVSDKELSDRTRQLLACLDNFEPDALLTELFPFGRRILAHEFLELLIASQKKTPKPVVFSSIRDILAPPSKQSKVDKTQQMIDQYYNAVLVHSDPALVSLDASWPTSPALQEKLRYTGFVAPPPVKPNLAVDGKRDILVTTGGGSVGMRLFETAVAAAALDATKRWRLLVGGENSEKRVASLRTKAPSNLTVSSASPDFRQMLYHASASVSFCGYNTALDVLQAGTPAVFVPFDDGGEVEQGLRAESLAHQSGIEVLRSENLSAGALLASVNAAQAAPKRGRRTEGQQGAERTVEIVCELAAEQHR